ncbi:hypothetical protein ACFL2Y_04495 [Candidatus Omnitrophota bacterium]
MGRKSNWLIFGLMVLYLSFFGFITLSYGADKAEEKEIKVETKEVTGEICGISPMFISVVYKRDEETGTEFELPFTIEKDDLELVRIKDLKLLSIGDTVEVEYEEASEEVEQINADGNREKVIKLRGRKAKKISFLKPAKVVDLSTEDEIETEDSLMSGN